MRQLNIVCLLIAGLALAGCGKKEDPSVAGASEFRSPENSPTFIGHRVETLTDHQTGCQYVIGGGGIAPRIALDGKSVMGCKGN